MSPALSVPPCWPEVGRPVGDHAAVPRLRLAVHFEATDTTDASDVMLLPEWPWPDLPRVGDQILMLTMLVTITFVRWDIVHQRIFVGGVGSYLDSWQVERKGDPA